MSADLFRHILRRNALLLLGIMLSCYFSYHLVYGKRSYIGLEALNAEKSLLESEYESLRNHRIYIEDKVVRLRDNGAIDIDLLQERVTYMLGKSRTDNLIVLNVSE